MDPTRDQTRAADREPTTPVVPAVETTIKQEWEYEYLEDLGSDPKARLNELGQDGWSLVTANPFIFRRPKLAEGKVRGPVGFAATSR